MLSWAIGGGDIHRWHGVPFNSFLDDVVTEDILESLPGQVEVVHGRKRLQRPLRVQLRQCVTNDEGTLLLDLVRTHASKGDAYDLVPYLCTDGATAVRIPEVRVRFIVPRGEPERFSHAFATMPNQFRDEAETHIGRQVLDLINRELPGCVLRRKVSRFFCDTNRKNSPLAITCVLVLNHASGDLLFRMDTCGSQWLTMMWPRRSLDGYR